MMLHRYSIIETKLFLEYLSHRFPYVYRPKLIAVQSIQDDTKNGNHMNTVRISVLCADANRYSRITLNVG